MSRSNNWFVPGDGIAREVITADIQRYLGPDALVRPGPGTGEYEGRPGYWITAYRTLTSNMIQDLKLDSQRWQQEQQGRQDTGRGVAYQDSRTHAARQHWGPSDSQNFSQAREREPQARTAHSSAYATEHYTTAPAGSYNSHSAAAYAAQQPAYPTHAAAHASHTAPRTVQPDYAGYAREHAGYPPQTYTYAQPTPGQDSYAGRPPPPTYPTPSPVAAPGYYIASDGRQYPLAQQPQQPQQPTGRRRPA